MKNYKELIKKNVVDRFVTKNNSLIKTTNSDISDFSFEGVFTICKVVDIYDADTVRVIFHHNNKIIKLKIRLSGCDASEMFPKKKDIERKHLDRKDEMKKARIARNRMVQLVTSVDIKLDDYKYDKKDIKRITEMISLNEKLIYIQCLNYGKYGRVLGTLYLDKEKKQCVNNILLEECHAVVYNGGSR